jgi:hypothetical protein
MERQERLTANGNRTLAHWVFTPAANGSSTFQLCSFFCVFKGAALFKTLISVVFVLKGNRTRLRPRHCFDLFKLIFLFIYLHMPCARVATLNLCGSVMRLGDDVHRFPLFGRLTMIMISGRRRRTLMRPRGPISRLSIHCPSSCSSLDLLSPQEEG